MADTKEREHVFIVDGCLDARDIEFKGIPERVELCPICLGNGRRRQRYIEGVMSGPCDFCDATGFVYKETARGVPMSVTNQIAVASGVRVKRFYSHGLDWKL